MESTKLRSPVILEERVAVTGLGRSIVGKIVLDTYMELYGNQTIVSICTLS